jgi:hypothetical protein
MTTTKQFFNAEFRLAKPNVSSTSLNAYVSIASLLFPGVTNIKELQERLEKEALTRTISRIEETYKSPSTRMLRYNTIIILLKHLFSTGDTRYINLSLLRDKCGEKYTDSASKPDLNSQDKKNMVSTKEYDEMMELWQPRILMLMKKDSVNPTQLTEIMMYHALLIYLEIAIRNDLADTDIVFNTVPTSKEKNYLVVSTDLKRKWVKLVLNNFKTDKSHGQIVIDDWDEDTVTSLTHYAFFLKKHFTDKGVKQIPFLFNRKGDYLTANQFSNMFSSVFADKLNKRFNITLNRKRMISESPETHAFLEAKEKLSDLTDKMGTSNAMAVGVYNKKVD